MGSPFDWGLDDNICRTSRDDPIGSSRVNYNLGASLRRPAFLSSNNTLAVSVYTERRSEFKVYLRRETGTTVTLSAGANVACAQAGSAPQKPASAAADTTSDRLRMLASFTAR